MKNNVIFCEKSLSVELFILGYRKQGESILLLINCDDTCVFSLLIDSYKEDDLFIMDSIISNSNIKHLDVVCWSHPHDDHSIGLKELIEKYKNEKTIVFIPPRLPASINDCSNETKQLFTNLFAEARSNKHSKIQFISENQNMLYHYESNDILYNNEIYKIEMKSLASFSNQLIQNHYCEQDTKK